VEDDPDRRRVDVTTVGLDGKVAGRLTFNTDKDHYPILFEASRQAVALRTHAKGGKSDVLIYDLDSGVVRTHELKRRPAYVRMSSDGAQIGLFMGNATNIGQWTFEILDADSGESLRTYRGKGFPVTGFGPDFQFFHSTLRMEERDATALTQIDIATGNPKWSRKLAGQFLQSIVSPDGAYLSLAGYDKIVYLLDAKTGQDIMALRGHEGTVSQLRFSPCGRWLATSDSTYTVRVWSLDP
jgi:WD40 repeat protein